MEEKIFYDNADVKVTSTRFIVDKATYPIANISSVKSTSKSAGLLKLIAIILILIGALGLLSIFDSEAESDVTVTSLVFLGIGIWLYRCAKTKYLVMLTTAGTESQALESKDKNYIDAIVAALNNAIVHRG